VIRCRGGGGVGFELLAQATDVHAKVVGIAAAPHLVQEVLLAAQSSQHLQQSPLGRGQPHHGAGSRDAPAREVDDEVARLEDRYVGAGAAVDGADAASSSSVPNGLVT